METAPPPPPMDVDIPDEIAAAVFRRLVAHLRHRHDAENIDLMILAGFCRNCLAEWVQEAGGAPDKESARKLIYGMDFAEWKARYQGEASEEQLARMKESMAKNAQPH